MSRSALKINNMYLLGAGFARSIFEKSPLNDELLCKLIEFLKKKSPKDRSKNYPNEKLFDVYLRKYQTKNIEEFLTFLDLESLNTKNPDKIDVEKLRTEINSLIAKYFIRFKFNETIPKKPWLRDFAEETLAKNDVIVDLNYDTFMGSLLDFCKVWSPNGGFSEFITNGHPLVKKIPQNKSIKNNFYLNNSIVFSFIFFIPFFLPLS